MKTILISFILFLVTTTFSQIKQSQNPLNFLPKGYILYNQIDGDLNNDGLIDKVLIIKGTDKSKIVAVENQKKLDRNRRGIIILFNKNGKFDLALNNYNCFSSENEDGGVYFAPELSLEIKKGNLYISYGHGRYGRWQYTFRYRKMNFELIGYDETNGGVIIDSEISINFLTKKKLQKVNINENAESGDEVFKENWFNITVNKLIKLNEIKDFDTLSLDEYK